ncbi:MAG: arginase family protein [Actinomycetota bacterium]
MTTPGPAEYATAPVTTHPLAQRPVTLLGVPTSAGAHGPGQEQAPAVLRALGLTQLLARSGVNLRDGGDVAGLRFAAAPRICGARSLDRVVRVAGAVADAVDHVVVGEGRLPLLIGGDCTITVGAVAGLARSLDLGLMYFDGDADLSTPETSGSGILDAMGMAHLLGLGAPALASLGRRRPLLRAEQVTLFGFDPAELDSVGWQRLAERRLRAFPAPMVRRDPAGAAAAALAGLEPQVESFLLHFDVDALDSGELPLADFPHFPGLSLDQAMQALTVLASSPKLAGVVVTEINPDHDPDRRHLRQFTDRLAEALTGS